jgi:GNAT superfamily N-acetyltransferase
MTKNIRSMTEEDVLDVLLLAKEFSKEAPASHKWDKNKTLSFLQTALSMTNMEVFVYEKDGEILGGLVGCITEMYVSYKKMATEFAFFVTKEARGSSVAVRLVKHFEDWAKQNGADYIILADIQEINDLSKLYGKLGYKSLECTYIKEA